MIGRKRDKKILLPNSVHTRPGQENCEKNRKKKQKITKPLSSLFYSQNRPKKRKNILVPNSVHTRPGQENSEKNSKKIQKIEKPLSGIIFSQNGMR